MENTFLKIKNVNVIYDNKPAIEDISVNIGKGEIVSIIGPNGSGKSTLIKAILNLVKFKGEILLENKPVTENLNRIGYMPQSEDIDINFPITVKEVVWQSQYRSHAKDSSRLVRDAITINNLHLFEDRNISELSGGQLQRTFLARAIAQDGDLLILDEPFSNMDIQNQTSVIKMLHQMKAANKTILITTHNLKLAQEMSTKILLLNKKVISYGACNQLFEKNKLIETFGEDVIFTDGENISLSDHHSHAHKH